MTKKINMDYAPVFITGAWRSGTTLISRILNNHPDFDITYDSVHYLRFAMDRYNPINNKKNVERLVLDISERLLKRNGLRLPFDETLKSINNNYTHCVIYDSIMKNLFLKRSQKKIWGEKTNLAWTKIPHFLEMYPQGRILHIVRDPRAVLSSWKKFTHAPGSLYLDSILNCYDSMTKACLYKELFKDKRYALITYEELVSDPVNTVNFICEKFKIEFNADMLDTSGFRDIVGNKWQSNSIHNENMDGISSSANGMWKDHLEAWEIYLTDVLIGDRMELFHYEKSKIEITRDIITTSVEEVQKSRFVSDGLITFLLTGEGFERYPSDPLNSNNWAISKKKSQYEISQ